MHRDIPIRITQNLLPSSLFTLRTDRRGSVSALTTTCVDHARTPIFPATIGIAHCRSGWDDGRGSHEAGRRGCALAIDCRGVGCSVTVVILAVYDAAALKVRAC
jgi:hypothetical protein